MLKTRSPKNRSRARLKQAAVCVMLIALAEGPVHATDLSNAPLASGVSVSLKPNIMFILDDSGSMDSLFVPDSVGSDTRKTGFVNFQCNPIYYNPSVKYLPPKNSDGTDFSPSTFTTPAKDDGYSAASSTTTISTSFKAYGGDTAQKAYYWLFTPTSGTATLTPDTGVCLTNIADLVTTTSIAVTGGTWKKVIVSTTSGPGASDETGNFANWYSYYRKRIMMMKAAGSRSFVQLGNNYRVGFITINPMAGASVSSSKFLKIGDFDAAQKASWFKTLFLQSPGPSTPLREALSRVGRYYAGKNDGINAGMIPTQADDPVQYSCQQNFAILTTDGFWNTGNETVGPVQIDGKTAPGEKDGDITVAPRPMYDGASAQNTTVDKWNEYRSNNANCGGGGSKFAIEVRTWTVTTTQNVSGGQPVGAPTTNTSSSSFSSPNWVDSSCQKPALALPPDNHASMPPSITFTSGHTFKRADPTFGTVSGKKEQPAPTPNPPCTAWPCTSTTSSGGSTNSLADVAQYYYNTDLRDTSFGNATGALGTDVSQNNVPTAGTGTEDDKATWQHMTTFTMGLGVGGNLTYLPDYKTATTGDFNSIRGGSLNWPVPKADDPTAVDDLWHAAVNGRGIYFSASDPNAVIDGLTTTLSGINARIASAAAAATSNLEPVAGDNFAYTAKYTTQKWFGELEAHEIDLASGTVSSTVFWSAQTRLDAKTGLLCDNRSIKLFHSGAANNVVNFTWGTQTCDASGNPTGTANTGLNASEQDNFSLNNAVKLLSQFSSMTDGTLGPDQKTLAVGANLVNFVRGQRGKENFVSGQADGLYRGRDHILGDIVNAQPVYVRGAIGAYSDTGYAAFITAQANRTPMVYIAANDGMLHAFLAGTSSTDTNGGNEAWAFIPTMVLPNLYKLADNNYANNHQYFVDGTPTVGDVFDPVAGAWKTILVGGLNAGGKGYYALDITDPATPKGLWEFKYSSTCFNPADSTTAFADCNLGYTFGNPLIAKLADGRWVVFVSSGYNNVTSNPGDGKGYLYVLEAATGKILFKIATSAGDTTTPSGLNKIAGFANAPQADNTALRVYGVDVLGNIWRFDVNNTLGPTGLEAELLGTATDPSGVGQPITTKPELGSIGSPAQPYVFVATGRYLGPSDLSNTQVNSVYAIQESLSLTPIALRTALKKNTINTTMVGGQVIRQTGCTNNCTSTAGWFVDLPESGERVNVDPKLQLGTLVVGSNIPENNACSIGGHSNLNFFDYSNGLAVSTSPNGSVGQKLSDSLIVGLNIVRLPNGKTVVIATTSDAKQQTPPAPFGTGKIAGRRVSWRELMQ